MTRESAGGVRRAGRRGVPVVLAIAVSAGCATPDAIRKVEEDTRLNHSMVLGLGEATGELRQEIAALRAEVRESRDELASGAREEEFRRAQALAEVRQRVEAMEERLDAFAGALRGVEMSVGGLTDQIARLEALPPDRPPRSPAPAPQPVAKPDTPAPAPASAPAATADEVFERALDNLERGELGQAILDFEDFLAKFPSHTLSGAARFWIGEAYFAARDYEHATMEYEKAVETAPKGEKTPEALLKMGQAYRALRRHDRAREAWTQLVRDFPESGAAQKARIALRETTSDRARSTPD